MMVKYGKEVYVVLQSPCHEWGLSGQECRRRMVGGEVQVTIIKPTADLIELCLPVGHKVFSDLKIDHGRHHRV
jgi:hypothetical protein